MMKLALDSDPPSGSGTTSRIPKQTLVCVPSVKPNLLRGALVSCACSDKLLSTTSHGCEVFQRVIPELVGAKL